MEDGHSIYTIDRIIDKDPLVQSVRLCKEESKVFRKILPFLYAEGKLLIEPTSGKTNYRYRRVLVELYDEDAVNESLLLG